MSFFLKKTLQPSKKKKFPNYRIIMMQVFEDQEIKYFI